MTPVSNVALLIVVYIMVFLALAVVFAVGMTLGYKFRDKQIKTLLERKKANKPGKQS